MTNVAWRQCHFNNLFSRFGRSYATDKDAKRTATLKLAHLFCFEDGISSNDLSHSGLWRTRKNAADRSHKETAVLRPRRAGLPALYAPPCSQGDPQSSATLAEQESPSSDRWGPASGGNWGHRGASVATPRCGREVWLSHPMAAIWD